MLTVRSGGQTGWAGETLCGLSQTQPGHSTATAGHPDAGRYAEESRQSQSNVQAGLFQRLLPNLDGTAVQESYHLYLTMGSFPLYTDALWP